MPGVEQTIDQLAADKTRSAGDEVMHCLIK
jgi:hypothetical protein